MHDASFLVRHINGQPLNFEPIVLKFLAFFQLEIFLKFSRSFSIKISCI